ncbi:MAG: FHA domain-containing protein [Hyphomicrobiaceae bacterium]
MPADYSQQLATIDGTSGVSPLGRAVAVERERGVGAMAVIFAQSAMDLGLDHLREIAAQVVEVAVRWAEDGYSRAPALMTGIAAFAVVPFLGLAGYLFNRWLAARAAPVAEPAAIRTELAAAQGLGWPCDGWLTIDGPTPVRRALPRELLSIGRENDNDLQLDDATVHRHHAVLHRTPEAQFVIRDLSGQAGNGVTVNGRRVDQVALRDGDQIGIGVVKLRFEAEPA